MQIAKIIHEGGLTAYSTEQAQAIVERHKLRPVLLIESRPNSDLELLLGENGSALGIQASTLYTGLTSDGLLKFYKHKTAYDMGAALYHCANLAKTYELIVADHERT